MNKRRFLITASAVGAALPASVGAARSPLRGPGLLTISGAVTRSNRGPLDSALDQLMARHGARFDKAFVFDAAMLGRLTATTIEPTLEVDAKRHKLSGPLLGAVIEAAGVAATAPATLALRAVDGYTVNVSLADALAYRMIVATALDGAPMNLGGLGPLWAVIDADRVPAFSAKPLKERFTLCPWALYHIDVQPPK